MRRPKRRANKTRKAGLTKQPPLTVGLAKPQNTEVSACQTSAVRQAGLKRVCRSRLLGRQKPAPQSPHRLLRILSVHRGTDPRRRRYRRQNRGGLQGDFTAIGM